MLRLYLDEDVDVLLAELLRAGGYDCVTTVDANRLGSSDEEQLELSSAEGRILLTHNRADFERITTEWWNQSRSHSGVLAVIRRSSLNEIVSHLVAQLDMYDQAGWRDNFFCA